MPGSRPIARVSAATPAQRRHHRQLAVEPQQVVLGQGESADRRVGLETTMGSVPVIAMELARQIFGPLV